MKFALKFSMPKWERPKQEAPYISNPLINELEKIDFASLTAERRQDILHRLKLACAAIAEDRRHQPAILSDRIRLQKMWQDYFKIAQTTPAGDNLGESLSISRYSEQEEEKPRALGAVMTMQEELVAAANFKIDLGGLDINDMDDMDDFSPSSIPRVAPAPPPAQATAPHAPAPHAAAAHLAASRNAAAHHEAEEAGKTAPEQAPKAADAELAEQMAKIKAVAPMALPAMAFPSEPVHEQVAVAVEPEAAFSIEMTADEAEDEPQEAAQALSPEDELAEQMAKIKAVAPMALPIMAFPSDPAPEQVAIAPEAEAAFSIEIIEEPEPAQLIDAAHDHDGELAEQMAKVKAVAPIGLPPMPHPADKVSEQAETHADLHIEAHGADDHPDTPLVIEEDTLHIHDGHLEETAPVAATMDAEAVEVETVNVVKAAGQADESGFRPLTIAVVEAEPAPPELTETGVIDVGVVEPEIVQPDIIEPEIVSAMAEESPAITEMPVLEQAAAEPVEPVQTETAQTETVQSEPVAAQPVEIDPVVVPVAAEAEKPAEAKPKRSRKASALATLRSMLSSNQSDKPADETPAGASEPEAAPLEAGTAEAALPQEVEAVEPVEAALPPKEREVSATPSTKEWVNIKLLRPSVIRGLPLPDQVITIVPYTEAKRLEENGSAIILTKPRTPRSSS